MTAKPDSATLPHVNGQRIRRIVLEQSRRAHVGHIGSALSVADIIASLYGPILRVERPDDPERERFILSKGHAALALYAALFLRGWITENDLNSYCGDNSLLGVHPERVLAGIDFSTGSLGQGLSMATGVALAQRLRNGERRTFALLSDAECNEGAVWEAAMFAAHQKLSNLIVIVDLNGQQALNHTDRVINMGSLSAHWLAFGWDAHDVDGHDSAALANLVEELNTESGPPHVLVAHTTFGKGVSYMERQIKWHYWPMSEEEFNQAMREIESAQ